MRLIHVERNSTGEVFMEEECNYLARGVGSPGMRGFVPYRRRLGGQILCVRLCTECLAFTHAELNINSKRFNGLFCEF